MALPELHDFSVIPFERRIILDGVEKGVSFSISYHGHKPSGPITDLADPEINWYDCIRFVIPDIPFVRGDTPKGLEYTFSDGLIDWVHYWTKVGALVETEQLFGYIGGVLTVYKSQARLISDDLRNGEIRTARHGKELVTTLTDIGVRYAMQTMEQLGDSDDSDDQLLVARLEPILYSDQTLRIASASYQTKPLGEKGSFDPNELMPLHEVIRKLGKLGSSVAPHPDNEE